VDNKGGRLGSRAWGGLAVAACLLLLAPGAVAANSSRYDDGVADAPVEAPDLTEVGVTNDDGGTIVFRISIPNRTALQPYDLVSVFVDADGRLGTGCARGTFGAEYSLSTLGGRFVFGRCSAGSWSFVRAPASFAGSFADSALTLKVNRRDLGGARALAFRVGAAALNTDGAYDFAPDVGTAAWGYRVLAPTQAVAKKVKRQLKLCKPRRCRRR
jgi:hypothetical protein